MKRAPPREPRCILGPAWRLCRRGGLPEHAAVVATPPSCRRSGRAGLRPSVRLTASLPGSGSARVRVRVRARARGLGRRLGFGLGLGLRLELGSHRLCVVAAWPARGKRSSSIYIVGVRRRRAATAASPRGRHHRRRATPPRHLQADPARLGAAAPRARRRRRAGRRRVRVRVSVGARVRVGVRVSVGVRVGV